MRRDLEVSTLRDQLFNCKTELTKANAAIFSLRSRLEGAAAVQQPENPPTHGAVAALRSLARPRPAPQLPGTPTAKAQAPGVSSLLSAATSLRD